MSILQYDVHVTCKCVDMWRVGGKRRLLALCGITIPFCLIYILKLSVLSAFLLCVILGVSVFALKIASIGAQRNIPIKRPVKSSGLDVKNNETATLYTDKARIIFPVSPFQRSPLKEAAYVQRSGYNSRHDYRPTAKSKHFAPLSPILTTDLAPPKTFSKMQSPGTGSVCASPVFSNLDSRNVSAALVRSSLSSVWSPLASPANNSFVNLSPQHFNKNEVRVQPIYTKAAMFPLSNRHYPTHQPDYTCTNMGILPASSIFHGDGSANSLGPLRRGGGVRTHSPVTVKIARPDNRRSASPLLRRLSLDRSSGSPLHKDTIIAALNEKRKRVAIEEQDDSSSVASSAAGGVFAKRRRLDNGSRCSTPSIGESSDCSVLLRGAVPSDSSADEGTRFRVGAGGLQSKTPRNPIDSSVSSSMRAALTNKIMRKRMLIQPAKPESSPSKKVSLPPDDVQMSHNVKTFQSNEARSITDPEVAKQNGEFDSEGPVVVGEERSNSSEGGTPTKLPGKNLSATRLKTPKLRMLGCQELKNCSSPGEYTAADLEEDRHLAKQRVNYILKSLKDGDEEDEDNDNSKDQQPSKTVGFAAPQRPLVSTEPTTAASTLSSTNLLELSKMNTLPVSAIQKGQLLLPSPMSKTGSGVKDKQPPAQSITAPATSTQQTGAASESGALAFSKSTPLTTGFLSSGSGMTQAGLAAPTPTSTSALGFTVLDSSKSEATPSSLGQQASGETSKFVASQKDAILKGMLAGTDHTSSVIATAFQLGGAPPNATPGLMMAGRQVGTDQAGLGQAPSGQSLPGLLSQGTPLGVFSLASSRSQPQTPQGGLAQSSTMSAGPQQSSTTGSLLFSQALGGGSGLTTAAPSIVPSVTATSSGFQFSASATNPVAAPSGPMFGSAAPGLTSTAQSTVQFGAHSQTPQSNTSSGFQMSTAKSQAPASTVGTGGIQFGTVPSSSAATMQSEAHLSTPFQFGGTSSTTTKTATPTMSFSTASGSIGGQPGTASMAASSGLFNPTIAASGSIFGSATAAATATKPSFTPAFGQAVSATPAQPSNQSFNFSAQPAANSTTGGFQFKPAFGAPPKTQPSQSRPQPSNASLQFGSSMTESISNPAAASGSFTFSGTPATAATATASPFQSAASSTTGGIFGQQPTTQPPSFGTATAQPASTFGGPPAGQSMFVGQSTAPTPSAGGFNFGAPGASQANHPAFNFAGAQPAGQPASGGMFQFGQQAGSGQQAGQPMGGFGTPSKPPPYNFGPGAGSGFGTPAPSAAPSFGGVTPTNQGGFSLGTTGSAPKRTSRMSRQARQTRRR